MENEKVSKSDFIGWWGVYPLIGIILLLEVLFFREKYLKQVYFIHLIYILIPIIGILMQLWSSNQNGRIFPEFHLPFFISQILAGPLVLIGYVRLMRGKYSYLHHFVLISFLTGGVFVCFSFLIFGLWTFNDVEKVKRKREFEMTREHKSGPLWKYLTRGVIIFIITYALLIIISTHVKL